MFHENKFERVRSESQAKRIEAYALYMSQRDQRRAELQRLANAADAQLDMRRKEYKELRKNRGDI